MSSACISLDSAPSATAQRELRANVFAHRWGVVVQVFVPGCGPSDIKVRLNGEVLTVVAAVPAFSKGLPIVCERATGETERDFALTRGLDAGRLTRSLQDGVLTLTIPKEGAAVTPDLLS